MELLDVIEAILKDHLIDDFPADNTSPSIEEFAVSVKFLIDHHPFAPMAPHNASLHCGMSFRAGLLPHPMSQEVLIPQPSMEPCFHDLDLIEKRGEVNKVNPVFFRERDCISWVKKPEGFRFDSRRILFRSKS